jgi:flagellar export protein FliJ
MGFQFSLATVLRVRESIEKREERALQKILIEITRVTQMIEALNAMIAGAHIDREDAMRLMIPAGHLHTMQWEMQSAAEKKQTLLQILQTLEQQRDEQMKAYQAAHRDRETLTDMMDRQRGLYDVEQNRAQQKRLDDIVIARHHRS